MAQVQVDGGLECKIGLGNLPVNMKEIEIKMHATQTPSKDNIKVKTLTPNSDTSTKAVADGVPGNSNDAMKITKATALQSSTTPQSGKASGRQRSTATPTQRPHNKRQQIRHKKNMDFHKMTSRPVATPPPTELTPPRSGATPPHLRSVIVDGQRRVQSSPSKPQASPSPASSASPPRMRPLMPPQKRQMNAMRPLPPPPRPGHHAYRPDIPFHRPKKAQNPLELKVIIRGVPAKWTTWDAYQFFEKYGNISRIDVDDFRGTVVKRIFVHFQPAPKYISWVGCPIEGTGPDGAALRLETINDSRDVWTHPLSCKPGYRVPERMSISLFQVDFGVLQDANKMLVMESASGSQTTPVMLTMDLHQKALFVSFPVQTYDDVKKHMVERHFRFRINPAQITQAHMMERSDQSVQLTITLDHPPMVFRNTTKPEATHDSNVTLWNENQTWFRQTDIDLNPWERKRAVALRNDDCIIDLGRWLTYSFSFTKEAAESNTFRDLKLALQDHNILVNASTQDFTFEIEPEPLWNWLDAPVQKMSNGDIVFADLHQLADENLPLPFNVRYQLEVCLSNNTLNESNIDRPFLKKLLSMDPARAVKVLEQVADSKERYFNPNRIFRLQNQVSVVEKKRPSYCTKIPSAIVTPTTIYFATPVLETSNRVIRHFQQYEDRFLRVKFTDERYRGGLMGRDDRSMDELYSRVSRAMTNGIKVGDRHYEFLAFGNSQFREHGAYFFAPTGNTTAESIRKWMGDFSNIKVIAKHCSRLGQGFSTTRAIPIRINLERIGDVERNGFCFTDGVGKISPFLARIVATHHSMPNSETDYPSMFQFRLAGCKGVLAVDPTLKGMTVQVRDSQDKFPDERRGLEICRISQFSTVYLNMQIILVLSALGVPDDVFVTKLKHMLEDLQIAMIDEQRAQELLQKNIDFNGMTIQLASMICDGFMDAQEPFFMSCLRLWRCWNLKYLQEKARIAVDEGAFLLGGTDETQTLKGHFDVTGSLSPGTSIDWADEENEVNDGKDLPEIFLQIPEAPNSSKYKVITGICVLARNPSLHPGDVRVVKAVDVPALHHIKNVVLLPQTGDRDLANMCSGGDLDGDDYMVIWDKELIPKRWNHPPMDYTSPTPATVDNVTVAHITNFFVKHIKFDNLARIAVAHRYWADATDSEGVMDEKCLRLAELHSKAVDFAKTGIEAKMPKDLIVKRWPHWSEPKNKATRKTYHSKKVLGKLYDEVKREPFHPAWDFQFDQRVLTACAPSEEMLQDAQELKTVYDEAVRRIMAQHGVNSEFEVWTTFALEHHQDFNDYKFAEKFGEIAHNLRSYHQELCYEKAGTSAQERDWEKMKPFIVAMYTVTANEVTAAVEASKETLTVGGKEIFVRPISMENMPFMSFPWLFMRELGQIATKGKLRKFDLGVQKLKTTAKKDVNKQFIDLLGDLEMESLKEVQFAGGCLASGGSGFEQMPTPLTLTTRGPLVDKANLQSSASTPGSNTSKVAPTTPATTAPEKSELDTDRWKAQHKAVGLPVGNGDLSATPLPTDPGENGRPSPQPAVARVDSAAPQVKAESDEDNGGEEVEIEFEENPLDRFAKRFG